MKKKEIVEKILKASKIEYRTEHIKKGLMRNKKDRLLSLLEAQLK